MGVIFALVSHRFLAFLQQKQGKIDE